MDMQQTAQDLLAKTPAPEVRDFFDEYSGTALTFGADMSSIMLSKPHRQTLNGTSLDFQERMAELGVTAPTHEGATPCIVVATVRDDMEISALSLRLAARNIRLLRLNVDDLPDVDIVTYLDTLELIHGTEALRPVLFWARYLLHHPQRATAEPGSEAGELLAADLQSTAWKYTDKRSYRSVILDAGHLNQNIYLVGTALGLAVGTTAVQRDEDFEMEFGLSPALKVPLMLTGVGHHRDPDALTARVPTPLEQ